MRKLLIAVLALVLVGSGPAIAHQPVVLLESDISAAKGPLLVDGTISFAVRAAFTKAGQRKAFRAQLAEGDSLAVQLLIVDKKPENTLKITQLPSVVITGPTGKKVTLKINERTKFFEPYGGTNYLYLARYNAVAIAGIYSFLITSRAKSEITLAVGEKEIRGEVVRGLAPAPTPTPTPTPTVVGYTMEQVKANNTAASCWSAIDAVVYNLTNWIPLHPGGSYLIQMLCGTDGSAQFRGQHANASNPAAQLAKYRLGPLK